MKISTSRSAIPKRDSNNLEQSMIAIDSAINLAKATRDADLEKKFSLAMLYAKMEGLRLLAGAKSRPAMERKLAGFMIIAKEYTSGEHPIVAGYCMESHLKNMNLKDELSEALPFATTILLRSQKEREDLEKMKVDEVVSLACDLITIENGEVVVEIFN